MVRTKLSEKTRMSEELQKNGVIKPAASPAEKKPRKKRRNKNKWKGEAREMQKPHKASRYIAYRPFREMVKSIAADVSTGGVRLQPDAVRTLHEVAVDYLGDMFRDANLVVINKKAHTLRVKDMQLVRDFENKAQRRFSAAGA